MAVLLFCFSSAGSAENRNSITVAGIKNKIPLEFKTGKHIPAGIYVELWKIWSEKTGIPVNYIISTPDDAEKALENGTIDVIMGYHPSDTGKKISLSLDIYQSDIYIYHNDKITSAENIDELIPYKVGATPRESEELKKLKPEQIFIIKNSVPELIEASERGEINIFIAESALLNHEIKNLGLWRKFIQSSEPVLKRGVKAAVRADNKYLLQIVNSGFSRITETERLVVERTWAGGNFKYRIPWGFLATFTTIIILLGGVVAIWWWNFQLHKKIESATEELTILKEEAEAASIAKSRFLDNISHELRTPLTLILAPVEDAMTGKPLGKSTLEMIHRNSLNLLSLINDLLDISRMSAGMMNLKVTETDLCAAVRLYCAEMESAAEHRGIELSCSLPDEPAFAFIDTKKFSNIISNLFSNSFKFTKDGGKINILLLKKPESFILKFSDTGSGIPSSKIGSVFNLFCQGDTETSATYGGTGIGLALVKEIAEMHGGNVSIESRHIHDYPDGHGTELSLEIPSGMKHLAGRDDVEFCPCAGNEFNLPIARIINPAPDEKIKTATDDRTGLISDELPSIIIVEDNEDMLQFLERLLSDSYTIYPASNGIEAINILNRVDSIDLILSDVMMPEMDGHELMRRIKSDERFESIPVLFLTARGDDLMKHEGLELGAVDYVTKPFNSDELKLRIKNQMELRVIRNNLNRKNEELYAKLKQHMNSRKTPVSVDLKIKLESVCEFIKEHFLEDLSRDKLASAADMNSDTFSRMFNQHTGKTLPDYITELRINEVMKRLAETDDAITRICFDTGFDSIRTFNRAFKKFTGKTPGEYRVKTY
jgi:signal transduction histidine kinase/DNA-binding response OmpR family regulator